GTDRGDLGRIVLVFRSLDQSRHVGAASRDEHGDLLATHASPEIEFAVISDSGAVACLGDTAEHRHGFARVGESFDDCVSLLARGDDNHSDAAIEGPQHFALCNAALCREPLKHRRNANTCEVDANAKSFWKYPWDVVGETTAGDMGEAFHSPGFPDHCKARLNINPGGSEDRFAKALLGYKWCRRGPWKSGPFDDLAHERIAVGMQARRRKSDNYITFGHVSARKQRITLNRADGEAGKVIVVAVIHTGPFGSFSA